VGGEQEVVEPRVSWTLIRCALWLDFALRLRPRWPSTSSGTKLADVVVGCEIDLSRHRCPAACRGQSSRW
jgi:hypothetical protein